MYDSELSKSFEVGDEQVSYTALHRRFVTTKYGKKLSTALRFAPYKPVEMSGTDWEKALGPDVVTLSHLLESWKLVKWYLAVTLASGKEMSLRAMESLQIAALIHDWQEGLEEVGDVQDTLKTEQSHLEEMAHLRRVIREVADPAWVNRLDEVVDGVLTDQKSGLGLAFRSCELMGYVRTGIRAWKKASVVKGSFHLHFRFVAMHVFSWQVPRLLALAPHHPPVAAFLRKHEAVISDMAALPFSEFRYFPPYGVSPKATNHEGVEDRFLAAVEQWNARELPEAPVVALDD